LAQVLSSADKLVRGWFAFFVSLARAATLGISRRARTLLANEAGSLQGVKSVSEAIKHEATS